MIHFSNFVCEQVEVAFDEESIGAPMIANIYDDDKFIGEISYYLDANIKFDDAYYCFDQEVSDIEIKWESDSHPDININDMKLTLAVIGFIGNENMVNEALNEI